MTHPNDKKMFIELLQAYRVDNYIVATGDQTTDAPSLQIADVGITINSGSDFTKSKAGILLWRNDGFTLAKEIVEHGRSLYQTMRKFLQFELTCNMAALFILLWCACVFGENAFSGVQIMWLNLIMDSFCALSLQMEQSDKALMKCDPYQKKERIATAYMIRNIFVWSLYQIAICMFLIYASTPLFGITFNHKEPFYWDEHDIAAMDEPGYDGVFRVIGEPTGKLEMYTVVFNCLVFMNIFNLFNARILD